MSCLGLRGSILGVKFCQSLPKKSCWVRFLSTECSGALWFMARPYSQLFIFTHMGAWVVFLCFRFLTFLLTLAAPWPSSVSTDLFCLGLSTNTWPLTYWPVMYYEIGRNVFKDKLDHTGYLSVIDSHEWDWQWHLSRTQTLDYLCFSLQHHIWLSWYKTARLNIHDIFQYFLMD